MEMDVLQTVVPEELLADIAEMELKKILLR